MIYLKKIEEYGIKSFADKLSLPFNQPITAIVGPNGCGKSNVCDAVKWVLGEQSSKDLRGKAMQDLIFNGTDTRKSMSYCEVSLFIDNTTRIFPIDMDEIIISRKLYRNNESDYLLNRNVVRLRDIQELLRAVGLGKESYAIVAQGRMDAVLNASPEKRRGIFEEALGVSGFRKKKEETENKLEKTRVNMDSLNLLSAELERQITPLRRQSTIAKKYLDLRDKLRYHEINAYIYSYDHASSDKEVGQKKIAGLKEEHALRSAQYDEVNAEYERLTASIAGIDEQLSALHDKQLELAVDLQRSVGDKNVIVERINNVKEAIANTEDEIASYKQDLQKSKDALDETMRLQSSRKQESEALENEIFALTDKYNTLSLRADEIQKAIDQTQNDLTENLRLVSEFSGKQASVVTETEANMSRLASIERQEKEIAARMNNLSDEEKALLDKYDECKNEKERLTQEIATLTSSVKQQQFEILEYQKRSERARSNIASEEGSITMLLDMTRNYRGYQSSVQNLMQDAKKDRELASHLCDVVANVLKVEPKYQTAIDVALGGHVQNVITRTSEDTKYAIKYLKDNVYGRVTFLPISEMKPRGIDKPQILHEEGVLGIAKDLVKYDAFYAKVFESILGGTVIVDTYDNATALSRKYGYAHRIVTLTGERISNDGSVEGGSKKPGSSNLLSYESELSERNAKLAKLKEAYEQSEKEYVERSAKLQSDSAKLQKATADLQEVNIDLATAKEKIGASNTLSNSDKNQILGLAAEKEKILERLAEIKKRGEQSVVKLSELKEQEKKSSQKLQQLRVALAEQNKEKDAASNELSSKRYRNGLLKANVEQAKADMRNYVEEQKRLSDNIESKSNSVAQYKQSLIVMTDAISSTDEEDEKSKQLNEVVAQINSADTEKVDLNKRLQKAGDDRLRLSTEIENILGSLDKEEFILNKIDEDLAELQQRVYEEYNITYSQAMQFKDDQYDHVASKEQMNELRTSIQNLGYVNVNAIEDLKSVEERYGNIGEQLEDLRKAESDLKEILKDLSVEIETRFESGMEQINENFKIVFRELFHGGNAKLTLDKNDPDKEPLDYGVEIEAQPPGKKLQNISLLSGGERTMTAAAILFAILKLHPMPFCILDEIEAALDDANAERIARYLKNFSKDTQFIVITHKKPTMENADVLFGVTMEEKGVSKIVSVKLNEAVKQAM